MIISTDPDVRSKPDLDSAVIALCETILAQDGVSSAQECVESFFDNADASTKYTSLAQLGSALHRKQHQGEQITDSEEQEYQRLHGVAMSDPVVTRFLQAKSSLENIHAMVNAYVGKTLELGRVPSAEDFQGGGCCGGSSGSGGGCGCN